MMEDWFDVPEIRRARCASEPAGSVQEKAPAAGQTHLQTQRYKKYRARMVTTQVLSGKQQNYLYAWLNMTAPLTAEL